MDDITIDLKGKWFEKVEMLPTEGNVVAVSTRIRAGLNHEDVKNLMAIAEKHDGKVTIFRSGNDGTSDLVATIHWWGKTRHTK